MGYNRVPMTPTFSLIVPTRQRTAALGRLLASVTRTASDPAALEAVLVVDADDADSRAFTFPDLRLARVVVEPGLPMGALNAAGYAASGGDYLMLLNDDVVARTRGWDRKVLARCREYPDGIVLVHTNDRLFGDVLCTFPIVSRTYCELAGGVCPPGYVRYRIDDHIEDVFNLLGVLGETRSVYLPGVVFEHLKHAEAPAGEQPYRPDEAIMALDAPRFETLFAERKRLALRLREHIAGGASAPQRDEWRRRLEQVPHSFALRVPGRQRVVPDPRTLRGRLAAGLERVRACVRQRGYRGLVRAAGRRLLPRLPSGSGS
jgi:hypothetical protein